MRDLCTRALYKISSQDPQKDISIQDLRISLDLLGLFTGALYKISSQNLYERSLYKISWYPWTSEISSLQDLFKRPLSGSNTQKVPRGLRGRNQNRHRATARAIPHAQTPQRVARAETKNAPGWAPATFHQQNEHGATARAIRHAQSPERVAFANIKSAPRHSETQKIRVPTAPWRQNYNTKCDFSMFCDASTAPATKKWVRGIRSPVTATRNDVNIADPNSTTVSQNEHFELSKTDFKSTKYCACHEKWRFFITSNFEQPFTTILHTSQNPHVLHISGFPKIDTARRRERTSEMDLVKNTFRAGEMHFFDLEGNFSARGSPKKPDPSVHTTDLHQMLFTYRKNPIVWPHCLGKKGIFSTSLLRFQPFLGIFSKNPRALATRISNCPGLIVGSELERWCQRCANAIEKPGAFVMISFWEHIYILFWNVLDFFGLRKLGHVGPDGFSHDIFRWYTWKQHETTQISPNQCVNVVFRYIRLFYSNFSFPFCFFNGMFLNGWFEDVWSVFPPNNFGQRLNRKPFNATYWLLLMIGSLYRETLTARHVVPRLDPPEQARLGLPQRLGQICL